MITWGDFILDDWLGPTLKSDPQTDGSASSVTEDRLARTIQDISQKQPILFPYGSDQEDRCQVDEVRNFENTKQVSTEAHSSFPIGFREEEGG